MTAGRNPSVPDSQTVTATVAVKGGVVRDSHSSSDMYAAVDAVSHGLAGKLAKYKDRRLDMSGVESAFRGAAVDEMDEDLEEEEEDTYAAASVAYGGIDEFD